MLTKSLPKIDKSIFILVLFFVVSMGSMLWHLSSLQSNLVEANALDTARQITIVLRDVRALYTSDVVTPATSHGVIITHDTESIPNSIPLPATFSMRLGELIGRHAGGAQSKLYSPFPFPWRKDTGGLRDSFANEAWKALSRDNNKPYAKFVQTDSGAQLRYAIADRMGSSCVQCHNTHPQSPKTDWKVGDLRGIIEVTVPLTALASKAKLQTRKAAVTYSVVGFLLLAGLILTFSRFQISNKTLARKTTELELANNQLTELSEVDPLTGIKNRRYYEKQLRIDVSFAKRAVNPISLLLIDIDHFKAYNDNYGHDQGDIVLKKVASAIRGSIPREGDWVARIGGEEFAVILPATDVLGASTVGEYIRTNVAKLKVPHMHSTSTNVVTVSVGMSSMMGSSDLHRSDLFRQADLALYNAKLNGRNCCKTFDESWAKNES